MSAVVPQAPFIVQQEECIPERMDPGTICFLPDTRPNRLHDGTSDPFIAVFSCPRCGTIGYITLRQFNGSRRAICASFNCSAEYSLVPQPESDEIEIKMHPPA